MSLYRLRSVVKQLESKYENDGARVRMYKFQSISSNEVLTGTTVDLLLNLCELAGDVSGVAVEHGRVPVANLAGVVQDNDLSGEVLAAGGRLVLGV